MVQEMKERTNQEIQSLRSQLNESSQNLQQALSQAQQQTQQVTISRSLEPQILRIFDSNRIQTYSIEVLDPETFKQLQVTQAAPANTPKVSTSETTVLPPISQLF
jgi:molecular chaperone GrpE (heat shock protein)